MNTNPKKHNNGTWTTNFIPFCISENVNMLSCPTNSLGNQLNHHYLQDEELDLGHSSLVFHHAHDQTHYHYIIGYPWVGWDWVHMTHLPLVGLVYQPWIMDDDRCGASSRIIGRGNQSTRRKPDSVPLCPPQILHDLTQTETWATAVGSKQLNCLSYGMTLHNRLHKCSSKQTSIWMTCWVTTI
jgi:hypothetical protein